MTCCWLALFLSRLGHWAQLKGGNVLKSKTSWGMKVETDFRDLPLNPPPLLEVCAESKVGAMHQRTLEVGHLGGEFCLLTLTRQ